MQELKEIADNICLSGGAEGADLQFGMCAGQAGHGVIHWSYPRHKTDAPHTEVVVLTPEQLEAADPHLVAASKRVKRNPLSSSYHVRNLLRRNWYQVKDAERVYAVAKINDKNEVSGGTAWAVAMFIDRFNGEACEAYVFDMVTGHWCVWNGLLWEMCDPPKPHGVYAGIGSRELQQNGKEAIRTLLGYEGRK